MTEPRILWLPDPDVVARSRMAAFRSWLAAQRGVIVADYDALSDVDVVVDELQASIEELAAAAGAPAPGAPPTPPAEQTAHEASAAT